MSFNADLELHSLTGHASGTYSHANGYKVDLAKNSVLNSYVQNSFTKIANRSDGYPQWQSAAGNIYCDEGNHVRSFIHKRARH